ncbi:transcriptional regulator [Muribaculaceae bacterium Isolate-042 (Harlan)]|uniref:Transcriptional regulator n=1 Tax=Muribaculum intestinale TaxID=1796646 RepID=A0A1B1SDD0_9BACT|nr:transcriptional regulator [Muribaculum intestinale]ROS81219.1 transcriptional regulator [Muribaculaceae bacterium Isolate-042 (Harlan)]ASB39136.1 transcriptional regulator [Muribaculum intestinale]PWB02437.1 transcriptional regulator [Muribaculum intestinale]PWB10018.1 transcriptional regulator [Muribaculum intestinale]
MACTSEFIEYICDMLAPLGEIHSRKMMGDYIVYVNEKCVITACDNIAYVKKLPCIAGLMADAKCGCPYTGAKEAYILDLEDAPKSLKVIETIWEYLPFPKSKKQ